MCEVLSLGDDFASRDEFLAGSKHGMHDDGEFTGNGHRRALEPNAFPQLKAPGFEITNDTSYEEAGGCQFLHHIPGHYPT